MTAPILPLLLAPLLALPALCAPLPPGTSLEEAEAAIELELGEVAGLALAFEAGATVYAQAPDLAAAAERRKGSWYGLTDRFYALKRTLFDYRNELRRRELQAAAHAFNNRTVDSPLFMELSPHLETATRLELSLAAVFKTIMKGANADAAALRAETQRRRGRRRLRRSALTVLAGLTAGALFVFLLRRRKPAPAPAPVKRPGFRRPRGPGRLE